MIFNIFLVMRSDDLEKSCVLLLLLVHELLPSILLRCEHFFKIRIIRVVLVRK